MGLGKFRFTGKKKTSLIKALFSSTNCDTLRRGRAAVENSHLFVWEYSFYPVNIFTEDSNNKIKSRNWNLVWNLMELDHSFWIFQRKLYKLEQKHKSNKAKRRNTEIQQIYQLWNENRVLKSRALNEWYMRSLSCWSNTSLCLCPVPPKEAPGPHRLWTKGCFQPSLWV